MAWHYTAVCQGEKKQKQTKPNQKKKNHTQPEKKKPNHPQPKNQNQPTNKTQPQFSNSDAVFESASSASNTVQCDSIMLKLLLPGTKMSKHIFPSTSYKPEDNNNPCINYA